MSILNYSTKIDAFKTAGEIQRLLATKGAKGVNIEFENGSPSALYFQIYVNDVEVDFRLPCNANGVLRVMAVDKKVPRASKNRGQAVRTAWRIVKDWVEAQFAMIESGQMQLAEVFLPCAVTDNGRTLFQRMSENPGQLRLVNRSEKDGTILEGTKTK